MKLDPVTAERLARVCGLFGSDHVGERGNAAALADRIVRDAGLTWHAVILGYDSGDFAPRFAECIARIDELTPYEANFVRGVARFRCPTPKQRAVVEQIYARLRQRRAAA